MKEHKKDTLSIEELNTIAANATFVASKRMRSNSETIITIKEGLLVEEDKDGTRRIIRRVSSRSVEPGTKISIK